jgi:WD40 repeat protein
MNGNELLMGTTDGAFQQWTVDKRFLPVERKDLDFKPGRRAYTQSPSSQFISPNGDKLAVINDSNLQILDLTAPSQPVTLSEFNSYLTSLEFSADGNMLALVDYNIHLWDMDSHKTPGTLQTNTYEVSDIAFSPSGKQIVIGANGLEVWDISTFQKVRENEIDVYRVAYSPDGSLLAAGGWYDVTILNANNGKQMQIFKSDLGEPFALSFGADGKTLLLAAQNGMRLWDVSSGKLLQSMDEKKQRIHNALIYSSDNIATENFINCWKEGIWSFGICAQYRNLTPCTFLSAVKDTSPFTPRAVCSLMYRDITKVSKFH